MQLELDAVELGAVADADASLAAMYTQIAEASTTDAEVRTVALTLASWRAERARHFRAAEAEKEAEEAASEAALLGPSAPAA